MGRKFYYYRIISNDYLGVTKEIKGSTEYEVALKVEEQLRKWETKERAQRQRDAIEDMKSQAEFDSEQAQELIEDYKSILISTLKVDDKLKWEKLKEKKKFKNFHFNEPVPTLQQIMNQLKVPNPRPFVEFLIKSIKLKRIEMEERAQVELDKMLADYENRKAKEQEKYEKDKQEFIKLQNEHNEKIDQFKLEFEQGHGEAIEKYVYMVLEKSKYPEGLDREFEVQYDPISGTVIISFELPSKDVVPSIIQYKYVTTKKTITEVRMKQKEFDAYYEDVLYQICLRTIHEVFEAVYIRDVKSVVYNGWVSGIDSKTGNDFRSCIMSCQAEREAFEKFNLERVDPRECFKGLKGLSAGPLAQLAPVRPVMEIRRDDSRFVESRDVLADINSTTNLATMNWEDFEHLVRELFAKVFSKDGAEVNVTQASRDGGVDAIAFDPDPIKGGKFVIQAKRYNNVVPVSAVRDLYGTLLAEGATKGILVTTSYFGNDSREFAKDKPITLIDGSNLVYMFQEYGHNVTIQLQKKVN
ncbi:restriction endonuclease [Brevibacillus brevis]|uniref:Restriction endonuclease n=1 Tax=Brevibacillus brevis TaxID=1393 RepID=A0A2Z4MEH2_BREBE|nr:restriction endonuclease [Brevibacillus brevis]AWX54905.1 restriction endonuclease [Brevibacillus brevis]